MKKSIYYLVSIILVILFSIVLVEIILQVVPIIYRNFPNINNDKQYVYIIGESSADGEPYQYKISYYKIFDYMLDGKIDNKKIEFIRLASGGDALSVQFWKYFIYKYTHPFKKGIVFIYAGKNNWDNGENKYNFSKYSKYNVFSIFNDIFLNNKNFKYNYERIILLTKKFGDDTFISTIEGNYAGFMPGLSSGNNNFKEDFNQIDKDILRGNYQKALNKLNELLLTDENVNKPWIFYRIGKICEFTGKNREANDNFIKAVSFDSNDLRPTQYQNNVIKILANKYNIELVDIFDKLYNSGEVIGFNFYMDNQHPNLRIYMSIARLFVDVLAKKYNLDIKKYNVSEEELYKYFNFGEIDKYNMYRQSLDVTLVHSKENENVNVYVFSQVDEYLKQVDLLNPYDNKRKEIIMTFYKMMVEALKGNKETVVEIFNNSNLINEDKTLIEARPCDWQEYNKWVSNYLSIDNFFDLSKGE